MACPNVFAWPRPRAPPQSVSDLHPSFRGKCEVLQEIPSIRCTEGAAFLHDSLHRNEGYTAARRRLNGNVGNGYCGLALEKELDPHQPVLGQ